MIGFIIAVGALSAATETPTLQQVLALYPQLRGLEASLADLAAGALSAPAGSVLFSQNDPCQGFPLLLDGEVRVSRPSQDGRALELYRLAPGEMCLVSSASLFRTQPLTAQAVATRPTRLLMVPPQVFRSWLAQPAFRDYVRQGNGLLVIHSGSAEYRDTPVLRALLGGVFGREQAVYVAVARDDAAGQFIHRIASGASRWRHYRSNGAG